MKIKVATVVGGIKYELDVEERDELETLHKAIVLANPRKTCTNCKEIGYATKYFTTNKDKEGNIYINVKCAKCGARSKLGQYKAGGYFWHDYELYERKRKEDN